MNYTVKSIAQEFNTHNITWAVGGDYMLKRYDIVNNSNIIDIMVSEDSIIEALNIMNTIATKTKEENNEHFQTEVYASYKMGDTKVNIICNLKCDFTKPFEYDFDQEDINVSVDNNISQINYSYLLDWYIIYAAIDRTDIVEKIENYYQQGGFLDNARCKAKFDNIDYKNHTNHYNKLVQKLYHL